MDLGLAGKRAVETGAGKGIGLAVAQTLAAEGVHVVAGSARVRRVKATGRFGTRIRCSNRPSVSHGVRANSSRPPSMEGQSTSSSTTLAQ